MVDTTPSPSPSYLPRSRIWLRFKKKTAGLIGLTILLSFTLVAIYAPILASSKPLFVLWNHTPYFPLFRYLFYQGFYTKPLDLFFNLAIFTFPLAFLLCLFTPKHIKALLIAIIAIHCSTFFYLLFIPLKDPASSFNTEVEKDCLNLPSGQDWSCDLQRMNAYAQLNLLTKTLQRKNQNDVLLYSIVDELLAKREQEWLKEQVNLQLHMLNEKEPTPQLRREIALKILQQTSPSQLMQNVALPTLWLLEKSNEEALILRLKRDSLSNNPAIQTRSKQRLAWYEERQKWIDEQLTHVSYVIWPFLRPFHWEEDAAGSQELNQMAPWLELTRINRKDLLAAILFGIRISLVIGVVAVSLSLLIGIPIGAVAGFFGGKVDIIICRLLEIWETMPSFLMLLMVVAIAQSKSIFLVITVIAFFGWTGFSRYIRAEVFKQRNLAYVEACYSLGFGTNRILFKHILPNAIPPLLTLLPFAIMAAVTSEAGLSFLGLGEEGSCSWGVLMNEGRVAFPGESYLLWPPAIALTALLVAVAMVGDSLRDAFDPRA